MPRRKPQLRRKPLYPIEGLLLRNHTPPFRRDSSLPEEIPFFPKRFPRYSIEKRLSRTRNAKCDKSIDWATS